MPRVLNVTGLAKSFESGDSRIRLFQNLDLSLDEGQSLALTGRSGSGKSTLIHILCGLERPDGGDIHFLGVPADLTDEEAWTERRRHRIATVFQETNLLPTLTLEENIRLRAALAGHFDDAGYWLGELGLSGLGTRFPDQVSGGQRQRAALAMGFAMRPSLMLADEPTGSLDRQTASQVSDVLFRFQRSTGCALLLATHDLELAGRCDDHLNLSPVPP